MRRSRRRCEAAAVLLAAVLMAAPLAAAEETSDSKAAAGGEAKPKATAAASGEAKAPAAAPTNPAAARTQPTPARKVWTAADLQALREKPGSAVLVLESKDPEIPASGLQREPAVSPQQVVDRYAKLVAEADQKLSQLQREKLAASNPFLRGLASSTGGPRGAAQIDEDIASWKARRSAAQDNLDRARELTGARPTPAAPAASGR